jgi:hypothetical protein
MDPIQFTGKEISLSGLGGYGIEFDIDPEATHATIVLPDDAASLRIIEQGDVLLIEADGASLWPEGRSFASSQQINANNGGVVMAPMRGNITFGSFSLPNTPVMIGSASVARTTKTYNNGVIRMDEQSSDGTTKIVLVRSLDEDPEVVITVPPAVNNCPPVLVILDGECFFLPERSSMM